MQEICERYGLSLPLCAVDQVAAVIMLLEAQIAERDCKLDYVWQEVLVIDQEMKKQAVLTERLIVAIEMSHEALVGYKRKVESLQVENSQLAASIVAGIVSEP